MKTESKTTIVARIKMPCAINAFIAMLNALAAEYGGQKLFVRGEDDCYVVFKKD